MPVVRTDSAAVAEFRRAVAYLDEQRPTAGERFALAYDATVRRILEFPEAWPPYYGDYRRCRVEGFPYWVVYEWTGDTLWIDAVSHDARRPGYWRGRRGPEADS